MISPEHRIACLRFVAKGLGLDGEGELYKVAARIQGKLDRVAIRSAKKYRPEEQACWAWLAMYKELLNHETGNHRVPVCR